MHSVSFTKTTNLFKTYMLKTDCWKVILCVIHRYHISWIMINKNDNLVGLMD